VRWGRIYASFLVAQVKRIDRAIGKSAARRAEDPSLEQRRVSACLAAVRALMAANPTWSSRQIAAVLGIANATAWRYMSQILGER